MSRELWTVAELASAAAGYLTRKGIETSRLDADLMLADVLGWTRIDLYTRFDMPVDSHARARYRELIRRRGRREPLAYILGRREFFGLDFAVGPGVLVPRPETEGLVEATLTLMEGRSRFRVLDLGTGSGCILLAILSRFPEAHGEGWDRSAEALEYARRNAADLGLDHRATFVERDLLKTLGAGPPPRVDLVVSNPPYIRPDEDDQLMPEVRDHEPAAALFDREGDGLSFHRAILAAFRHLDPMPWVVLELPGWGGESLRTWWKDQGAGDLRVVADLSGQERVLIAAGGETFRHPEPLDAS